MARIRPAKSQTAPAGAKAPAEPAAPRRRPAGDGPRERKGAQAARPRPTPQSRSAKTGSVTKAVQEGRATRFINEVIAELRKVSWPTRKQLFQATGVVIGAVAIVATYLGLLDWGFGHLVDVIFF